MNILSFFHLCDNDNYVPRGQAGYNPLKSFQAFGSQAKIFVLMKV